MTVVTASEMTWPRLDVFKAVSEEMVLRFQNELVIADAER